MNKVFQYIKITSIQVNDSYFTTQQITSTLYPLPECGSFQSPVTSLPAITFWIPPHYAKVFLHPAVTKHERLI